MKRLRYLARTYFHQDWDVLAPTPIEVVGRFRADEVEQAVVDLRADIDVTLASAESDEELGQIWLRRCGSMWNPITDGWPSFRSWFIAMRSALTTTV